MQLHSVQNLVKKFIRTKINWLATFETDCHYLEADGMSLFTSVIVTMFHKLSLFILQPATNYVTKL